MTSPSQDTVDYQTRACVVLWSALTLLWAVLVMLLVTGLISLPQAGQAGLDWEAAGPAGLPSCLAVCAAVSLISFLTGQVTGNVSQVDKLWSIVPVVYTGLFAFQSCTPRLLLMFLVTASWGTRLTYNFWRRGGYSWPPWAGEEDYRWAYVRKWPVLNTQIGWFLFNLLFISVYQHFLLLALTLPALSAALADTDLNIFDLAVTLTILGLVLIESVADQQQEEFQNEKWRRIRNGDTLNHPYSTGFVNWGLFSMSRHPNYLAEQLIWFFFYLFSTAATGQAQPSCQNR
eukprot:GFUD01053572.1.p1 GENE.GFUD01053572.1~~GFUD01053572.1.p1  ORF type:complete len:288 (+),score=47.52 GFUD01053572.1:79-942(+)